MIAGDRSDEERSSELRRSALGPVGTASFTELSICCGLGNTVGVSSKVTRFSAAFVVVVLDVDGEV
jgi:hypothetical protein